MAFAIDSSIGVAIGRLLVGFGRISVDPSVGVLLS